MEETCLLVESAAVVDMSKELVVGFKETEVKPIKELFPDRVSSRPPPKRNLVIEQYLLSSIWFNFGSSSFEKDTFSV